MALTIEEIDAKIDGMLDTMGITREQFQDRSVEYSSDPEKIRAINYLLSQKEKVQGNAGRRSRTSYAEFRRPC